MNSADVKQRIESAERMLREAKMDLTKGDAEETLEFLRAAGRHVDRAIKALETSGDVVDFRDAAKPRKEGAHAR